MALLRLVPPVVALLATFLALFLYWDTPVPLDAIGLPPANAGLLMIGVCFFCVALTNRRYGPGYAFAQVTAAIAVVAAVVAFGHDLLNDLVPAQSIPPVRLAAALGIAYFLASFVSIAAFDGARGTRWWTAPLFGFVGAALVFGPLFYAAAYAGTDTPWIAPAARALVVLTGEGLLFLIPFWALRRMVPPLGGFGGY